MKYRGLLSLVFLFFSCGYKAPPPGKPDVSPPYVKITFPQEGENLLRDTTVNFLVNDESPIKKIALLVDEKVVEVDTVAPYSITIRLEYIKDSSAVIKVKATDIWDNTGESKPIKVFRALLREDNY